MKQRAAKLVDDKLSSKKRKNGKIITEAQLPQSRKTRPRHQLSPWAYSSTAVCRAASVKILNSIPQKNRIKPNQTTLYPNFGCS